ncbi:MAG: CHAT domain-containing protein, partial [Planctomycetota bacterium]
GNLADLEARRGRLSAALTHFERARSRLEHDQADSHVARLLGEQAEALAALGAPESAQEAFEQAIEALDKHGLAAEAARARHGLGRALLRSGRLEAACRVLAEAQQRYVALGQTRAAARVDLLLAEAALAQADFAEARARLSQASRCLEENTLDRIALRSLDARILSASNRVDDALDALSAALADAERFDIPPLLADLLHQRAAVRRVTGDAERELADLDHAVTQAERVRGSLQAEQLRAAALSDRLELYHDRIDAHLRRTPLSPERVFEAIEQARSRTLLDALAESDSPEREVGDDPLARRHAELRSELSILYSRLAERGDEALATETLAAWRAEVEQREHELDELENRLAVRAGGDPLLPRPADLADVVTALHGDGLLVEYFLTRDMLHALVVSGDRVTVIRDLLEADALRRHVQNLQFQIARGARPSGSAGRADRLLRDVRVELQSLYERVVAPCIAGIDHGRRICFVPAGPLHAAPLHAAWDGEAYLIERHVVHYAPSAGVYARLVQRAAMRADRSSASRPLVVGVGDENAPEIQAETHEIAEQLAAKMLWAQDATIDAVLAALPDAALAHIACHGYFSRRTPRASGLRLHDRWLTAGDVARLRLAAELVVLSGCSTGRSVVEAGEEVFGLVRGFLSAGAPRTLLTLWPAHDVQTRHFMREFYRVVRSEPRAFGSTAQAVQRAMRHGIAEAKHPFLWAPFLLVGVP